MSRCLLAHNVEDVITRYSLPILLYILGNTTPPFHEYDAQVSGQVKRWIHARMPPNACDASLFSIYLGIGFSRQGRDI